jgi:phosphonate metabolism protein PhnN/1,5-bisphosphokinase (PRPP-forming)
LRGTLFLIVGPSGAGKDALIAAARAKLAGRFVFPKRVITRPVGDVSEDHFPIGDDAFAARVAEGAFSLHWQAHGHRYGVPVFDAALDAGRHVVVNVSREVVAEARAHFTPVRVIEVTAPTDLLTQRLRQRGREASPDIAARVSRQKPVVADATIVNDGALEAAVAAFLAALEG